MSPPQIQPRKGFLEIYQLLNIQQKKKKKCVSKPSSHSTILHPNLKISKQNCRYFKEIFSNA